MRVAPVAALTRKEKGGLIDDVLHYLGQGQPPPLDLRLRQKRDKVAALDMRFQRYRKAEP